MLMPDSFCLSALPPSMSSTSIQSFHSPSIPSQSEHCPLPRPSLHGSPTLCTTGHLDSSCGSSVPQGSSLLAQHPQLCSGKTRKTPSHLLAWNSNSCNEVRALAFLGKVLAMTIHPWLYSICPSLSYILTLLFIITMICI